MKETTESFNGYVYTINYDLNDESMRTARFVIISYQRMSTITSILKKIKTFNKNRSN